MSSSETYQTDDQTRTDITEVIRVRDRVVLTEADLEIIHGDEPRDLTWIKRQSSIHGHRMQR